MLQVEWIIRRSILLCFIVCYQGIVCNTVQCPKAYILREGICCKRVVCPKDFFLVPCSFNLETDVCKKCPAGSHLPDVTNSTFFVECMSYNCPEGTVPSKIKSHDGCSLYCKCDLQVGSCGHDPCACQTPKNKCPFMTKRTQNCGCDPIIKTTSSKAISSTEKSTTNNTTNRATTQNANSHTRANNFSQPKVVNRITTYAPTSSKTTDDHSVEKMKHPRSANTPLLIPVIVGIVILILLLVAFICIYAHCQRKKHEKESNVNVNYHQANNYNFSDNKATYVAKQINNKKSNHRIKIDAVNNIESSSNVAVGNQPTLNVSAQMCTETMSTTDPFSNRDDSDVENDTSTSYQRQSFIESETSVKQPLIAHPEDELSQLELQHDSSATFQDSDAGEETKLKIIS